jgi:hypothetical protein
MSVVVSPMSSGEFTAQVQRDLDVRNLRVSVSSTLLRELEVDHEEAQRVAQEAVEELIDGPHGSSLPSVVDLEWYWHEDAEFRAVLASRVQSSPR